MQKYVELERETSVKVSSRPLQLGFCNLHYFSVVFEKNLGNVFF